MTDWNFADVWETIAEILPDSDALVHGDRRVSWSEMDSHANSVARTLIDAGVSKQDKVAFYLYNCTEFLEATFGVLKAGLVPVNTNYRYGDEEIVYLWENADAVAVIFHGVFAERIERLRPRVTAISTWIWVDDGSGPCPSWAISYEEASSGATTRVAAPWGRSGDDLILMYTGGTTGMPKGVMWRQDDLFLKLNSGAIIKVPEDGGLHGVHKTIVGSGPRHLPACPLMHGTGAFTSYAMLSSGGAIVTLTSRKFDAVELLDAVDDKGVNVIAIVGDAFGKPILAALEASKKKWRLSTLFAIISSGVMWSEETKQGLLNFHPTMMLIDTVSSSEAIGMGLSTSTAGSEAKTASFELSPDVRVIDPESGEDVLPGSDQIGVLALGGRNPVGYYKDEAKSASTFKTFGGIRYSIPGDFAEVHADGSIHLLGRGSVVINTGGEKVFAEEVEEVLKQHPSVADAVAVGVPDDRFGEVIAAIVELRPGKTVTEEELRQRVRQSLAGFKAPKLVRTVDSIGRAPTGKVDYRKLREDTVKWSESKWSESHPT